MKRIRLIGIGAGDPELLTLQALQALREVDVVFLLEKAGRGKDELTALRRRIMLRARPDGNYRTREVDSPPRPPVTDQAGAAGAAAYRAVVADWHARKRALFAALIQQELADGETGALLLWGDPALYDQTIPMIERVLSELDEPVELDVVPGISAAQLLTARHRIPLNRVGESIAIITGREAEEIDPATVHNSVVMLDYSAAFQRFTGQGMDIYWGAYLGTGDELLMSGPVDQVLDDLLGVRAEARSRKGWIMDTYLLRRRGPDEPTRD
jgi:precorrin-6A synthase